MASPVPSWRQAGASARMEPVTPGTPVVNTEDLFIRMASHSSSDEEFGALPMLSVITLVIHRFSGRGKASGEGGKTYEVPLSPELGFVEIAVSLLGGGVVFINSPLPENAALGQLPAGYANGRALGNQALLHLLRRLCRSAAELPPGSPGSGPASNPQVLAWAARIEQTMGRALELALWAHEPCYKAHTWPAIRRGAAGSSRMLSAVYCRRRRCRAERMLQDSSAGEIIDELIKLIADLETKIDPGPGFHADGSVQLDDLILRAYIKVLVAVPEEHAPWSKELGRKIGKLRDRTNDGATKISPRTITLHDWYESDFDHLQDAEEVENDFLESGKGSQNAGSPFVATRRGLVAKPKDLETLLELSDALQDEYDDGETAKLKILKNKPSRPCGVSRADYLSSSSSARAKRDCDVAEGAHAAHAATSKPASASSPNFGNATSGGNAETSYANQRGKPTTGRSASTTDDTDRPDDDSTKSALRCQRPMNMFFAIWWVTSLGGFVLWRSRQNKMR